MKNPVAICQVEIAGDSGCEPCDVPGFSFADETGRSPSGPKRCAGMMVWRLLPISV